MAGFLYMARYMPQKHASVNGKRRAVHKNLRDCSTDATASHRDADLRAESSGRTFMKHDIAAMRACNIAGDRKPKSCAAFIKIAGIIEPIEWLKDIFTAFWRNPRPVIVDGDGQLMIGLRGCQLYLAGVTNRVGNQIGDAALKGL